jgi:hypothetical protein
VESSSRWFYPLVRRHSDELDQCKTVARVVKKNKPMPRRSHGRRPFTLRHALLIRHVLFASILASSLLAIQTGRLARAGTGWYLLTPPFRPLSDEEILRQFPQWRSATKQELHEIAPTVMGEWYAPLDRWTHEGSFDTATECEATRLRLIKMAVAEEPELRRKYPDGYPTLRSILLRNSRCIASDDPRLTRR